MRVVERLARRERIWRELDALLLRFEEAGALRGRTVPLGKRGEAVEPDPDPSAPSPDGRIGAPEVIRLGELYRAACADLMLAEAYDLPRDTVAYLHALVGRAHNALYRTRGFRVRTWATELLDVVPRRLRSDPFLRISSVLFWGLMLIAGALAAARPGFAEKVVGAEQVASLEEMYSRPLTELPRDDEFMTGFYINHNAAIGLKCYAYGLTFGLMTLYELSFQAIVLGTMFGHMATTPMAANFYEFVTAHGPFELTAIVFSGAAGLRLGWGLIDTKGMRRVDSLGREARASLPIAGAAVCLFVLAAFLEGFVSASGLPYAAKAGVAVGSTMLLLLYLVAGGRGGSRTGVTDE
ncbi:stage II sporulation protein M [Tautonia sociabilis]|uniref:Stage II sporulation protein M n=1 Tax=Tautonia sociabilis TaxID=2080755 RepID=A0A432MG03_9BACT|nr:stage II sporulation protein M [Tautonia sociabilis]RUL85417.1 stage II sporulation protein M [Tautonia sociabilis]